MAWDGHRETARIFTFPTQAVRRRIGAPRPPEMGAAKGASSAPKTYGGAWYHDVAIRDAEGDPKK